MIFLFVVTWGSPCMAGLQPRLTTTFDALLIGINQYKFNAPLEFPVKDVNLIAVSLGLVLRVLHNMSPLLPIKALRVNTF